MAARLAAVLPRFALLATGFLLATAGLTYAAQKTMARPKPSSAPAAAPEPAVLTVPDVRGQAYVFAKGILGDGGFGWRVGGAVQGYAANTVATQQPAPGTRVVDTGAPQIVLRLTDNPSYANEGSPENASPFRATALQLLKRKPAAPAAPKAKPKPAPAPPVKESKPKPAAKPVRRPAFAVPGAPKEPLDEPTLPARARALELWLERNPKPSAPRVRHFLFQHAWVVTGARFGWSQGDEALEILIRVDRRAQRTWGIGAKSERVARSALAFVRARER